MVVGGGAAEEEAAAGMSGAVGYLLSDARDCMPIGSDWP